MLKLFYNMCYYGVICFHYYVMFCFIYGFVAVWSYPFWCIAAYIALLLLISRTQQRCEVTALERYFANKLDKTLHDNFIVYWIYRPIRTFVDKYGETSANAVLNYMRRYRK